MVDGSESEWWMGQRVSGGWVRVSGGWVRE